MEKNKYKRIFPMGKQCKDNTKNDNTQIMRELIVPVTGTLLKAKQVGKSCGICCNAEAI